MKRISKISKKSKIYVGKSIEVLKTSVFKDIRYFSEFAGIS